ncbi:hypothetical protein [Caulobacter sp. NIBR2454]|uniref:hypothetical protein n=1 Tax=Caulobacter sp. NIBR2454 TaxID=3015996 RepID=UPI0022B7243B|nr:hypothetical protein [Caulobacter sp. NIBR2454]
MNGANNLLWPELLAVAETLIASENPTDAELRRSRSSVYYALFHHLARACADLLIGGDADTRSKPAWQQTYRGLEHKATKAACDDNAIRKFPNAIQDYGDQFKALQAKRHLADYDPYVQVARSEIQQDIETVKGAIEAFDAAEEKDRRAFCAFVLLKRRKD